MVLIVINYAELLNGYVRYIGTAPILPQFAPPYSVVNLNSFPVFPKVGYFYSGSQFVTASGPPAIDPVPAFNIFKSQSTDIVNTAAGDSRALFLTVVPGQEISYIFKIQDASNYITASNLYGTASLTASNYPWVQQEALFSSASMTSIAELTLGTFASWGPIGAFVEGQRRGAVTYIDNIPYSPSSSAFITDYINSLSWPSP